MTNQPATRFVWVRPPNIPVEHQGFLIDWKQADEGSWFARVMYAEPDGRLITDWIPADRLRPVHSEPNTGSAYG